MSQLRPTRPMREDVDSTPVITSAAQIRAAVLAAQRRGETVGFVPTMGALHEGHLSLVEASLASCDRTVVSIFINPSQFGADEDWQRYPRRLDQDLRMLDQLGCWLVFAPSTEEMYPPGSETQVDVGAVALPLEGVARPEHFRGVATVVLKLFQIVPADRAFFGQKDYQQTLVVKQMVCDLSVPINIEICPTVRESDGLAMSSRNAYLNSFERQQALSLWQALQLAGQLNASGEQDVDVLRSAMLQQLARVPGESGLTAIDVDYIAFVNAGTVEPVTAIVGPTVIAIAARIGKTRLIDNHTIGT